jgi:hypothetical protein
MLWNFAEDLSIQKSRKYAMVAIMRWALLLIFGSLSGTQAFAGDPEMQAYSVSGNDFDKCEKLVRPLLNPEGTLVKDQAHHRLIVVDTPEVQSKIGKILPLWAHSPKNIRIQITSQSPQSIVSNGYNVSGQARAGNVTIQNGRSGPVRVQAHAIEREDNLNASLQLLVMSGGKGYINISEEVPDVAWFITWGQPYGLFVTEHVQWRDIGAQMLVEPFALQNDMIRVRLTPSFSYLLNNEHHTIEVQQLSTEVIVANGAEIDLGGLQLSDKEFSQRFFLSQNSLGNSRRVNIKIRASIEDLGPKPNYIE